MSLELVQNQDLDLSFLRENLKSLEEINLVKPGAKLPFDNQEWLESLTASKTSFSLHLKLNQEVIGHAAVRKTSEGKIVLFFVLVGEKQRGKGYGRILMREVESFIGNNLGALEYFLNVVPHNRIAIGLYKKMGFEVASRSNERITMRKALL